MGTKRIHSMVTPDQASQPATTEIPTRIMISRDTTVNRFSRRNITLGIYRTRMEAMDTICRGLTRLQLPQAGGAHASSVRPRRRRVLLLSHRSRLSLQYMARMVPVVLIRLLGRVVIDEIRQVVLPSFRGLGSSVFSFYDISRRACLRRYLRSYSSMTCSSFWLLKSKCRRHERWAKCTPSICIPLSPVACIPWPFWLSSSASDIPSY